MVTRIYTVGFTRVNRLLRNLPKEIRKEVGQEGTKKIIFSAQRRVRYRYNVLGYGKGKFSTGAGFRSIAVKKSPRGYALWVAEYLALLEKRISTHWVSMETIEAHQAHPGSTMFKRASTGFPFTRPPILFTWKGPFIVPAIRSLQSDIPRILERQVNKAIQNSRR